MKLKFCLMLSSVDNNNNNKKMIKNKNSLRYLGQDNYLRLEQIKKKW